MFRSANGFRAQYQSLNLVVAGDFDEWRILLHAPDVIINGGRQFTEVKAKEQAVRIAESYVREEKGEDPPATSEIEWTPLGKGGWLNWRP